MMRSRTQAMIRSLRVTYGPVSISHRAGAFCLLRPEWTRRLYDSTQ